MTFFLKVMLVIHDLVNENVCYRKNLEGSLKVDNGLKMEIKSCIVQRQKLLLKDY